MYKRTHRRITRKVCLDFGVQSSTLLNASESPDRTKVILNHHSKEAVDLAMDLLKRAKKVHERGDCSRLLGSAVHYLQDYALDPKERVWVVFSVDSTLRHIVKEALVDTYPVPDEAIAKAREVSLFNLYRRFLRAGRRKRAEDIMYAATYMTALAFRYVLDL